VSGPLLRSLRRWRQAGAVIIRDPRAEREWQRILAERERRREQADLDEILRALDRVSRRW